MKKFLMMNTVVTAGALLFALQGTAYAMDGCPVSYEYLCDGKCVQMWEACDLPPAGDDGAETSPPLEGAINASGETCTDCRNQQHADAFCAEECRCRDPFCGGW